MPAKISPLETQEFRLEMLDEKMGVPEDEKTTVTIKLATVKQNGERAKLFGTYIREMADPEMNRAERIIQEFHFYDLVALEVYLTMVDCNLMNNEKPLFKFGKSQRGPFMAMSKSDFDEAWGMLDDETAAEIHSKVLEVNRHWIFGATVEESDLGEEL